MTRFLIYAATVEDLNQGWVWVRCSDVKQREIVRISNPVTGDCVYCEALAIDDSFLRYYNTSDRVHIGDSGAVLVMSAWYRRRLGGITTKAGCDLEISVATDNPSARVLAALHHPQIIVQIATVLALLSIFFGIVGIGLGIWSLCK